MGSCWKESLPPGRSPAGCCLPSHAALVWKCDLGPGAQTNSCGGASFDLPPSGNRQKGEEIDFLKTKVASS